METLTTTFSIPSHLSRGSSILQGIAVPLPIWRYRSTQNVLDRRYYEWVVTLSWHNRKVKFAANAKAASPSRRKLAGAMRNGGESLRFSLSTAKFSTSPSNPSQSSTSKGSIEHFAFEIPVEQGINQRRGPETSRNSNSVSDMKNAKTFGAIQRHSFKTSP